MDFSWLGEQSPVLLAFLATLGTYVLTAVGTTPVLLIKDAPDWLMDVFSGFAGGVMVAASCWSLLVPALERGGILPACVGLAVGAAFLLAANRLTRWLKLHIPGHGDASGEQRRPFLLFVAMTVHNFPEGLAIGVAFAGGSTGAAAALALGIGLQNIPEGLAIALPLRRQGMGRGKAFFWGQLSAIVEPIAGPLGAFLVTVMTVLLPYGMAFAAGAMLFVVVQELIPEAIKDGRIELATCSFLLGFAVMMSLDNAVG